MILSLTVAARTADVPTWTLRVIAEALWLIGNVSPASTAVYEVRVCSSQVVSLCVAFDEMLRFGDLGYTWAFKHACVRTVYCLGA